MRVEKRNWKLLASLFLFMGLLLVILVKTKSPEVKQEGMISPPVEEELPLKLFNVWLLEAKEKEVTVLYDGTEHRYALAEAIGTPLYACIADLVVEKGIVTSMTVKQDTIAAKVLRIGADFIELEGYGRLPLAGSSRVYQMYDSVKEQAWVDVLVGYTTSKFVLEGEVVCAALIEEPVSVTSIRVLLQSASYGGYYHDTLECGSTVKYYMSDGFGRTEWKEAGSQITITPELVEEYGGRMYLGTERAEGKLSLYNVKRAVGTPSYRGTLEVSISEGKLLVVNELSLEEYLYGVLPSEMPESFGEEALKAQAVCARSYACNQLLANRYHMYGAHVDDSMNCQVYQNYGENEAAITAVKATFGKILEKDGKCITAYYFSCSGGHTSDSFDVWGENAGTNLSGVVQAKEGKEAALTTEETFQSFMDSNRTWYDEQSVWFRWSTVIGTELDGRILERLKERQKAVPEQILLMTGENEDGMHFNIAPVEKFGTLEDVIVVERGESGIIKQLLLVGSEATYLLLREYNIRYVLAPKNTVYLQDGSTTSNMNLLPSAYFTVEKEEKYFSISGGGYGHGVGMSQYGARYLAGRGSTYEEILNHFYADTKLVYLYQ